MKYPRLVLPRIAIWRTPTDLHIGGPDSSVVLRSVSKDLVDVIPLLDGFHSVEELMGTGHRRWTTWLLSTLETHGLLAEGPDYSPTLDVRVLGTGYLAGRIRRQVAHFTMPGSPRLDIVASSTQEADRVIIADLVKRQVPHLVVRATQTKASVGPFVIPGRTSCLTCSDLAKRDLDETWPTQVFQLATIESDPTLTLAAWASAVASTHVQVYAHRLLPESASTTLEMTAPDGRVTYRALPPHPRCPCQVRQGSAD